MTVAKILIHVFIWVWCFSLYRCNVVCHSKKRLCCSDQKFVLLVAWMINSCVHTYPENDTSLCVGVHTHHVLSQIAESPSLPAEEQTHSEHSEKTAPSHEITGDNSPTEPSLSEEQPPVCTVYIYDNFSLSPNLSALIKTRLWQVHEITENSLH